MSPDPCMALAKVGMKRHPWMKWYPADWRSDAGLRMCSLAARGLWCDLLCIMHEAEPYGHLSIGGVVPKIPEIALLVGRPIREVTTALAELRLHGVCSTGEHGEIYSRRMERDEARRIALTEQGRLGGNPKLMRKDNPDVVATDNRKSPSKDKPRDISARAPAPATQKLEARSTSLSVAAREAAGGALAPQGRAPPTQPPVIPALRMPGPARRMPRAQLDALAETLGTERPLSPSEVRARAAKAGS